ncbi:MAG: amidohydrolase family protein [Vicinamibacterales bacterium]|jgi:predicted TIM-barrel fold metal-dependent hydrolase|nr:amidohydrolase family protein [Vicinamibacterales bacterium]
MIIDTHTYCFPPLDGANGGEERMKRAQVAHALHHQPALRLRDREPAPSGPLAPEGTLDVSDLPDVDFHVEHEAGRVVWTVDGEDYTKYYYPPSLRDLQYTPQALIGDMDYAGVDVALLHTDPMLERHGAFQAECVSAYPDRILSMAPVDEWRIPSEPDAVIEELTENIRQRRLHAIKFMASYAYTNGPEPWDDGVYRPFWEAATALGVPVFFSLGSGPTGSWTDAASERQSYLNELRILARWSERYPDTLCSVTHGFPWRLFLDGDSIVLPEGVWTPFRSPNCSIEVSFPVRIGDLFDFPYRQVWLALEQMVERIGARQLLWGTDMPFQNRFCTYRQSRDWIEKYCDFLSEEDLRLIMGGTAARVLGIRSARS